MSNRNGRPGPAHMASSKKSGSKGGAQNGARRRREPLQDNYYYEEPRQGGLQQFEDVSSYSSSHRKKEDLKELERQKKKGSKAKKAILITLAVLLVLAGGVIYYVFGYLLKDLTVETISKNKGELGIRSEVQMDTSIKNIALFGVDARPNETQVRSDAIMIVSVDNKHGKIKMISVLRDSNVSMQLKDDNGGSYYMDDKITHAYYYGGSELAVQTLNRNFDLNIEDFVTVDFAQMAKIVDAVGGVDIEISGAEAQAINENLYALSREVAEEKENSQWDEDYNEDNFPKIVNTDYLKNIYGTRDFAYADASEFESGTYHLNGNQAVAYGRIRYLDSDDVRSVRQQNVLKALIQSVRGKSKLEYPEMIRKLMPMCKTSLDFTDIMGMIPIMFTDFTMESITIPGEDENARGGYNSRGGWVYMYSLEEAARHINRFIYEEDASPSDVVLDEHVLGVSNLDYPAESDDSDPNSNDGLISSFPSGDNVSSNPESSSASSGNDTSSWIDSSGGLESSGGEGSSDIVSSSGGEEWNSTPEVSVPEDTGGDDGWEEGAPNGDVNF